MEKDEGINLGRRVLKLFFEKFGFGVYGVVVLEGSFIES